jgi:hypothetical protein
VSIYDELTPTWLKNTFLVGVDLTTDDGQPYPDELFAQCIEAAIKQVEGELQLTLDLVTVEDEKQEFYFPNENPSWNQIKTSVRPMRGVETLGMYQGNALLTTIPAAWQVVEDPWCGELSLVPQGEGLTVQLNALITPGGPFLVTRGAGYQPGWWRLTYQAGLLTLTGEEPLDGAGVYTIALDPPAIWQDYRLGLTILDADGEPVPSTTASARLVDGSRRKASFQVRVSGAPPVGSVLYWSMSEVPRDIMQAIGWLASMLPLDTAGDLIAGAGIANYSVSLDGYSESVGTTSSATNAGYGARILSYQKQLKDALPRLRARYGPQIRLAGV